jgi:N-dimethylarginine dimethylaminohydrolase
MLYSTNEYDKLRKIIVGTATKANWPIHDVTFRHLEKITRWTDTPVPKGPVAASIIKEANDSLDNLSKVLVSCGVDVVRPHYRDYQYYDEFYGYCPRDRVLIIGNKVISASMAYKCRDNEIEAIKPYLGDNIIYCNNPTVIFDAANILRHNYDILYLVSSSANIAGAEWLQETLGSEYTVHTLTDIYGGFHIDSTISIIRDGLVILNADRVDVSNCPKIFDKWDKIWLSSADLQTQPFIGYPYASNYIALNFLSVSPDLVICDPKQYYLRHRLQKYRVETIGVDIVHSRTLGGGHHCVTLDLLRSN